MKAHSLRPVVASLRPWIVPSNGFPNLDCWGCGSPLALHQPDGTRPEQFLATCSNCGTWFRVAQPTENGELIVQELTDLRRSARTSTVTRSKSG